MTHNADINLTKRAIVLNETNIILTVMNLFKLVDERER